MKRNQGWKAQGTANRNGRLRSLSRAGWRRQKEVRTALTGVVPTQGRAGDQQKQKEAEEKTAAVRSRPTGRGHGARLRWRAAARYSQAGAGAAEIRALPLCDTANSDSWAQKVCNHSRSRYEGYCAGLASPLLRRVGEREWTLPAPPLELRAAVGGAPLGAEPMAGRRGCGRGWEPPSGDCLCRCSGWSETNTTRNLMSAVKFFISKTSVTIPRKVTMPYSTLCLQHLA